MEGFLAQLLNGLQYGLLLFLIGSGLTLIFGVMGVINLAHGSLFMIGAYLAYFVASQTGEFWLAPPAAVMGGLAFGALLERGLFRKFREREHLDQVLLTFALILLFEEARAALLDNQFHAVAVPPSLDFSVPVVGGFGWSAYRLTVLAICLVVAAGMVAFVERTRIGSAIRAAAENPEMVDLLGLDARLIHTLVFAAGTALAMLAGALAAPLQSVYPGMGDGFLILSFIVVVIGGLGSIAGAFWAALLVGLIDTLGKVYAPPLAGIAVCGMMALVLLWRPNGLFARG
ncbi:MAG: branched-chain amino acid ABC transporter permease [Acetobacteraceae bacterium]|nr:branched-chain amino acid ABC transporter permease [Acetobacteraceae bacterium]